jgi:hypothetical protein
VLYFLIVIFVGFLYFTHTHSSFSTIYTFIHSLIIIIIRARLQYPRPDVSVAVDPNQLYTTGSESYILSTEQNTQTPENDGNNNPIQIQP